MLQRNASYKSLAEPANYTSASPATSFERRHVSLKPASICIGSLRPPDTGTSCKTAMHVRKEQSWARLKD